jgi:FkbM family methyltransferase
MRKRGATYSLLASVLLGMAGATTLDGKWREFDMSLYNLYEVPKLGKFYIDKITYDSTKRQLAGGTYWEENIGNLIAANIEKGSIAVDAGSHIGLHTVRMSRAVGPDGKVYSFEPQEKLHREQQENLRVNNVTNVHLYRLALGEEEKDVEMCEYNPANEGGQLIGKGGDHAKMVTLDSFNLKNVSLIKADVEYYEYLLFRGAEKTIKESWPVIIFEMILEGRPYDSCPQEMIDTCHQSKALLESWGYRVELVFGSDYIAFPPHKKENHPPVTR